MANFHEVLLLSRRKYFILGSLTLLIFKKLYLNLEVIKHDNVADQTITYRQIPTEYSKIVAYKKQRLSTWKLSEWKKI